jgi:hypothetical protein
MMIKTLRNYIMQLLGPEYLTKQIYHAIYRNNVYYSWKKIYLKFKVFPEEVNVLISRRRAVGYFISAT